MPVHEHLPVHAEEEPDLYAVEVEEEAAGGVVEVETSEGKTLYRV